MNNATTPSTPALAVMMADIKRLLQPAEGCYPLFLCRTGINTAQYYVCTSFTLTKNHLFLLELKEISEAEFMDPYVCLYEAASVAEILTTMDDMQLTQRYCCFCRTPDGAICALKMERDLDICQANASCVCHIVPFGGKNKEQDV